MIVKNFVLTERKRVGTSIFFRGTVRITTGFFVKTTKTAEVCSNTGINWYFTDTGKYTTGSLVEEAVRSFEARVGPIREVGLLNN